MKIETYIDSLVSYAMNTGLAEPCDHMVLVNRLLDLMGKDDYEPSDEPQTEDLEEILAIPVEEMTQAKSSKLQPLPQKLQKSLKEFTMEQFLTMAMDGNSLLKTRDIATQLLTLR